MQRRLEDVSHFFLGHVKPAASALSPVRNSPRHDRRPRVIYMASGGDHVTAAMIVAALAASATRIGRRVLVAQTHEQPLGVAFGLGVQRTMDRLVVEAASDLWVAPVPLLGTKHPGVLLDQQATTRWSGISARVDLVLVHVNHSAGIPHTPAMPIPDEFLVMGGENTREATIDLYRAIKRAVLWNPVVELGLIAVGVQDERVRSTWEHLVRGVATFLGRPCLVVGSVPHAGALSHAFLSGTVLRGEWDDSARALTPIANRWAVSHVMPGRHSVPAGATSPGSSPTALGRRAQSGRVDI